MAQDKVEVLMTLKIEVDVESWGRMYGTTPGQVRIEVANYVEGAIRDHPALKIR